MSSAPMEIVNNTDGTVNDDKITWNKERRLKWEDIKGIPDPGSSSGSITYSSIGYSASVKKDSLYVTVTCFFNKEKSWVKEDHKTADLLNHEQGHFDLNEIYARKLRKQLATYPFERATLKKSIQELYEGIWKECMSIQQQYDAETESSSNTTVQKRWDLKIKQDLKNLESYSAPTVKSGIH